MPVNRRGVPFCSLSGCLLFLCRGSARCSVRLALLAIMEDIELPQILQIALPDATEAVDQDTFDHMSSRNVRSSSIVCGRTVSSVPRTPSVSFQMSTLINIFHTESACTPASHAEPQISHSPLRGYAQLTATLPRMQSAATRPQKSWSSPRRTASAGSARRS